MMNLKLVTGVLVLPIVMLGGVANAKGCLKGAAAGAVAGHVAGHHAVLGAAGGCAIGRHMANKKAAEQQAVQSNQQVPQSPQTTQPQIQAAPAQQPTQVTPAPRP